MESLSSSFRLRYAASNLSYLPVPDSNAGSLFEIGELISTVWQIRRSDDWPIGTATIDQIHELVAVGRLQGHHEIRPETGSWQRVDSVLRPNTDQAPKQTTVGLGENAVEGLYEPDAIHPQWQLPSADTDEPPTSNWIGKRSAAVAASFALHLVIASVMSLVVAVVSQSSKPRLITIIPSEPAAEFIPMDVVVDIELPKLTVVAQAPVVDILNRLKPLEVTPLEIDALEVPKISQQQQAVGDVATTAIDGLVSAAGGSTKRHLRFSLSWDTCDDLDLGVTTPSGRDIWYRNRDADGGVLDVDANVNGETETPVENIAWMELPTVKGNYKVHVQLYRRHSSQPGVVPFTLVVWSNGKSKVHKRSVRRVQTPIQVDQIQFQ